MGLRGKLIPGDSSRFMAAGHAELLRILRNPGSQEQRCGPWRTPPPPPSPPPAPARRRPRRSDRTPRRPFHDTATGSDEFIQIIYSSDSSGNWSSRRRNQRQIGVGRNWAPPRSQDPRRPASEDPAPSPNHQKLARNSKQKKNLQGEGVEGLCTRTGRKGVKWEPEKLGSQRWHFTRAMLARARSSRPPWPRIMGSAWCTREDALLAWLRPRDSHSSAMVRVADASSRSRLNVRQKDKLASA